MKQKIASYLFLGSIITLLLYLIIRGQYENYILRTKPYKVICAEINTAIPYKTEIRSKISYNYKGVNYRVTGTLNYVNLTREKYNAFLMGNKNIIIMVSEVDPTIYEVLDSMDDYYNYKIKATDTIGLNCY